MIFSYFYEVKSDVFILRLLFPTFLEKKIVSGVGGGVFVNFCSEYRLDEETR